jgi:hypothetical protein
MHYFLLQAMFQTKKVPPDPFRDCRYGREQGFILSVDGARRYSLSGTAHGASNALSGFDQKGRGH